MMKEIDNINSLNYQKWNQMKNQLLPSTQISAKPTA